MKSALFACLLLIAGASSFPQDVAPVQGRIVDLWLQSSIEELREWLVTRGYAPLIIDLHEFSYIIIDGQVQVGGTAKDIKLEGLDGVTLQYARFNPLIGRLDFGIVIPEVSLSIGSYEAEGRYGTQGGKGKLSGSLSIKNLVVAGHVLLQLAPGPQVLIHNININLGLPDIKGEFEATWKCLGCATERDATDEVNEFANQIVPAWLLDNKITLETLLGEAVRRTVNRWW